MNAHLNIMLYIISEINAVDEFGCSALHYAAMRGNSAAAEVLLKYGADPNVGFIRIPFHSNSFPFELHDHNNITPFMTSCTYGTIEVFNVSIPLYTPSINFYSDSFF